MPRKTTLPANQRLALSIPEAAAALSVSTGTLEEFIAAGEIPLCVPVTTSGTALKRVLWRDLEAFLQRHRDTPLVVKRGAA